MNETMDQSTFVTLIDRKSDMLYHIARTLTRNNEDCMDALQETALKAWENRDKLRDAALFNTWLTRICINVCHSIGRKKKKYCLQQTVEVPESNAVPDPFLKQCLETLPPKYRLILVLHYLEGYSYQQIAGILKIPQTTVRSRLSRARDRLRKELRTNEEAQHHETL